MIELVDHEPEVNVPPAEYARLLGYPRGHALEGRARELADAARTWYARHGRPWIYARSTQRLVLRDGAITLDGESFASPPLTRVLRHAEADAVVIAAVSAGPEIEAAAATAWREEKPDEYFFLEVYGSAVVEHLVTMAGARLCAWADGQAMAVLPHYSPGYPEWDVAEQPRLAALLQGASGHGLPGRLSVLDSGMLRPKKSLLAVFGLTQRVDLVRPLTDLSPCETCSFAGCDYRRAAYRGPSPFHTIETPVPANGSKAVDHSANSLTAVQPLDLDARYAVNAKALARWTRERLSLVDHDDGTIEARFRYDGTTCTNMGRPLAFDYTVRLGARDEGFPIAFERCAPAANDDGHRHMCRYLDDGERLLATIADERPLAGARLDDVLAWTRPACAAGCYCDADSRTHKWGLVLETIHYALAERERRPREPAAQECLVR